MAWPMKNLGINSHLYLKPSAGSAYGVSGEGSSSYLQASNPNQFYFQVGDRLSGFLIFRQNRVDGVRIGLRNLGILRSSHRRRPYCHSAAKQALQTRKMGPRLDNLRQVVQIRKDGRLCGGHDTREFDIAAT